MQDKEELRNRWIFRNLLWLATIGLVAIIGYERGCPNAGFLVLGVAAYIELQGINMSIDMFKQEMKKKNK